MTDIELVKTLSGNADISDDIVSFYLDSTTEFIKAYCNMSSVPKGLKPTLIEMTSLRVRANTSGASSTIGDGLKTVASVSDGNQSVSFASGASGGKQFVSEEDFIAAYGNILDRYRKLVTSQGRPVPHKIQRIAPFTCFDKDWRKKF